MNQASLCLILVGLLASGAQAQSLGAAAQKEKDRRATTTKAKPKVISDEDLSRYGQPATEGQADEAPPKAAEAPAAAGSPSEAGGTSGAPGAASKPASPADPPSGMDELQAKIDRWRAQYRPVKARVDALEAEIKDLEPKAGGITIVLGPSDPRYVPGGTPEKTQAESARTRLNDARNELRRAKEELAAIEERARRDGVSGASLN